MDGVETVLVEWTSLFRLSLLETSALLLGDLAALCAWDLPVPTSQAFPSFLFYFPCTMSSFFGSTPLFWQITAYSIALEKYRAILTPDPLPMTCLALAPKSLNYILVSYGISFTMVCLCMGLFLILCLVLTESFCLKTNILQFLEIFLFSFLGLIWIKYFLDISFNCVIFSPHFVLRLHHLYLPTLAHFMPASFLISKSYFVVFVHETGY